MIEHGTLHGLPTTYLSGDLTEDNAATLVRAILEASGECRLILMATGGGDGRCAMAVLEAMRIHAAPVHVDGVGHVASASACILVGATGKRRISKGGQVLLHDSTFSNSSVPSAAMIETAVALHAETQRQVFYLSERTGHPIHWFREERWIRAELALSYRLVDEIIGQPDKE